MLYNLIMEVVQKRSNEKLNSTCTLKMVSSHKKWNLKIHITFYKDFIRQVIQPRIRLETGFG